MPHKTEPQALVVPTTKHPHFSKLFEGNARLMVGYYLVISKFGLLHIKYGDLSQAAAIANHS